MPNDHTSRLPGLAYALALVLLAIIAGTVLLRQQPPTTMPAGAAGSNPLVLARLDAIEARLLNFAAPVETGGIVPVTRVPANDGLERRIAELERRLDQLSTQPSPARAQTPETPAKTRSPAEIAAQRQREEAVLSSVRSAGQRTILDANATLEQRIDAWRELRFIADSYDDAIASTMAQHGLYSPDASIRADIWRQADGRSKHPAICRALLQALQTDGEAKVREEAAETLAIYGDQPGVEQALQHAANHDVEENVRRQAANSLRQLER